MDFKPLLSDIPSGAGKELLIQKVGNSEKKFDHLLDLCLDRSDPLAWRAAWIVDGADERWPGLGEHAIVRVVHALPGLESTGTLRCLLRLLCRYPIPEDEQGIIIDECFSYLVSDRYPVAVKVHAMELIYQHVLLYPELKEELASAISDQMDNNSVGFASRGRKILKQLEKR